MKDKTIDHAKLSLLLNELRLPATKVIWPQFAEQADKKVGGPPASSPPLPKMNWPSATAGVSNATSLAACASGSAAATIAPGCTTRRSASSIASSTRSPPKAMQRGSPLSSSPRQQE